MNPKMEQPDESQPNPEIPAKETQGVMDPREKSAHGYDFWANALLEKGKISREEHDEFIYKNNHKEEQLEKYNLPQLAHYGFFDSVGEIRERVHPQPGEKFIIRCKSKATGQIKRLLDANLDEVCAYGEKLPGGFSAWEVEVKEFVETIAAGTIIVAPDGSTNIEMWHGAHYNVTNNTPKYIGSYDLNAHQMRFHWTAPEGADDLSMMQHQALKALHHIFPNLRPKPDMPIYIEYGVRKNGEIYFIEANDSPVMTEMDAAEPIDLERLYQDHYKQDKKDKKR